MAAAAYSWERKDAECPLQERGPEAKYLLGLVAVPGANREGRFVGARLGGANGLNLSAPGTQGRQTNAMAAGARSWAMLL